MKATEVKKEIQSELKEGLIRFEKDCEEYAILREQYNMLIAQRRVMMVYHFKN